ncbi:MAG: 5-formyltetrahydrofolate cyclo-ligase [Rhizomicrobium sp.]
MDAKVLHRDKARARRAELARALPKFADRIAALADKLDVPDGAIVSGYWPMQDEADPRALMAALAVAGHPLALPRLAQRNAPLEFRRWKMGDPLQVASFGMSEPLTSADVLKPSVLLVPVLAFDARGHRLGYGGGYYDRTLQALRAAGKIIAVGVAYAGQEVGELPAQEHDQRLDAIVTEKGVRVFTA